MKALRPALVAAALVLISAAPSAAAERSLQIGAVDTHAAPTVSVDVTPPGAKEAALPAKAFTVTEDGKVGITLAGSDVETPAGALTFKITSLPGRGVLKAGMWADVVIFDPATVTDKSSFAEPNQLAAGMDYVLVNGVPVIAAGKATGALPGKVLRGPGTR